MGRDHNGTVHDGMCSLQGIETRGGSMAGAWEALSQKLGLDL